MLVTKKYIIGPIKQLIDLNGDVINFDVKFSVKTKDKSPFEILVVDQQTLDSDTPLKYKNVNKGIISGQVTFNKNLYKNFFLLLRSENETECEVTIQIKEIQPNIPKNEIPLSSQEQASFVDDKKKKSFIKKYLYFIIIGFVILLYFYLNKNKNKSKNSKNSEMQFLDNNIIQKKQKSDYTNNRFFM